MSTPYRIIIADDDPLIAELLEQLIYEDYPTAALTRAADGRAALLAYHTAGADLLMLDIDMPFLTGIQVTQTIRARGDRVPILLVSARLNHRYDSARDPATVFCAKPFEMETLLDTVAALLPPPAR